jgi:hypothetical protein
MPGLMSGDWKRSTVSGPQRLQRHAWTAPDLHGDRASPRLYPTVMCHPVGAEEDHRTPAHVGLGPSHFKNNLIREETERLGVDKPDDYEIAHTCVNERTVVRQCTLRVAVKNEILTGRC